MQNYDDQWCSKDHNFRNRDLVKTLRPSLHKKSRDRDSGLEIWDRDSRLQNLCILPNFLSSLLSWIFSNFWHFPTCFGCFLPANNKKRFWIIENLLYHFFAIFKISTPVAFGIETRPEIFETETCKNGSPSLETETKSRDSITDVWLLIYAVWFYINHTLYPTTLRWKTRTRFQLIELKVELNWYSKLFYYWCISMCFDYTFASFLSFSHKIDSGATYWIIISSMIPA